MYLADIFTHLGQPGRPARHVACRAASTRAACRSACSSSASRSTRRRCCAPAHALRAARPTGTKAVAPSDHEVGRVTCEPVIGLEVHVQLADERKIFCGCSAEFGAPPNTHTCPVCLGMPGALPGAQPRRRRARDPRRASRPAATIAPRQSSSRARTTSIPTCRRATRSPSTTSRSARAAASTHGRRRRARRVGSRASTSRRTPARTLHERPRPIASLVDLNRAGVPLIEIVTEPDMRSRRRSGRVPAARCAQLVRYLGVSDGNMEEGSFRCDANVSVRRAAATTLGTRAELKNINSFRFVEHAIELRDRAPDRGRSRAAARSCRRRGCGTPTASETRSMRTQGGGARLPLLPRARSAAARRRRALDRATCRATLPELPRATARALRRAERAAALRRRTCSRSARRRRLLRGGRRAPAATPKAASNWVMDRVLRSCAR